MSAFRKSLTVAALLLVLAAGVVFYFLYLESRPPDTTEARVYAEGANVINPRGCTRVRAAMRWNAEKTLEFRPWGLVRLVTRRLEDENTLIWEYPGQPTSRLKRICRLPAPEFSAG